MSIDRFVALFGHLPTRSIDEVFEVWAAEHDVDHLIQALTHHGMFVGEILTDGDIRNGGISKDVLQGFSKLMKEKADNFEKIRSYLMQQAHASPHALRGAVSKIQGQIGENAFVHHAGSAAELAQSGSQEAYDVVVKGAHGQADRFVQIKVYHDPHRVIEEIRNVEAKLEAGKIMHGSHVVRKIEFAVNDDIADQVREGVKNHHLHTKVVNLGASRHEIRHGLEHASERFSHSPLHNYFHDIFKGAVVGVALVGAVNGYLLWRGQKDLETAAEDTVFSSAIALGGVTSVVTTKAVLTLLGGPIGLAAGIGVGFGARAVMGRFFGRRHFGRRLIEDTSELAGLCERLATPVLPVGKVG